MSRQHRLGAGGEKLTLACRYFVAGGKLMAAEVSTGETVRASAPQPLFAIPLVWSLNAE